MSKHYDVVVLGTELGGLACGALLARRSWRVLVVGQGARAATYDYDGIPLARRTASLLAAPSPAFGRVVVELAQSQTFRRRLVAAAPMFQVLFPDRRFQVAPDAAALGREVDREFPEVRRVVDELYAELGRVNEIADAVFERDAVWPPGGFWERRETSRVASTLPYLGRTDDLLAELPREHAYRAVVELTARFASDLAGPLPTLALARLHGAWSRGVVRLPGGDDELREFFLECIRAHGGQVAMADRVQTVLHKGGRVSGVQIDGEESPIGASFVVASAGTRQILELADGFVPSRRALAELPHTVDRRHRFVTSVIVRDRGLPAMLGNDAFLVADVAQGLDGVHVQRWSRRDGEAVAPWSRLPPGTSLLVCEALLDLEGPLPLGRARAAILALLERYLPFVERHYLVVDSPHDGLPVWEYRGGKREKVDRASVRRGGGSLDAEGMLAQVEVSPSSAWGLGGEPLRSPLDGAFALSRATLPALGQEGQLIAAWGVARLITKTDRKREKIRRELWSKIELG
jgi:hypothetical protein